MAQTAQQKAAANFAKQWSGKGYEKQETSRFWMQLLQNVLGVSDPANYIEFEKPVQLSHTSYIDAYIPETKVLIEQKGSKINLHKAYEQSDGSVLTPYEQAKRYVGEMKASEKPRWIVVCNFQEFLVHDLERPHSAPEQILLKNIGKEFYRLQFLVNQKNENIRKEEEVSLAAGNLVGKLYKALIKEYLNQNEKSLRSLNILCVRIIFCLYAEDAGLFETRTAFEDYIKTFPLETLRDGLKKLFEALDTDPSNRDEYDHKLKPFPYVNGGLFADKNIEIPNFTQEIVDVIVDQCAPFNWSEISPTIFGAVFESTLNPVTRRTGGMHYTSIENIHKVIDPLFLDDLTAEFDRIVASTTDQKKKLFEFQKKLGSLTFLDPACGCGNFLTETYLSLRRLENKIISILNEGKKVLGFDDFICVKIDHFYGIEINDFAVTVAQTAMWIAQSQMNAETESILSQNIDFLPLKTKAKIVEGNALRLDWETFKATDENAFPTDGLFSGFTTETYEEKQEYDYIIGNPPFVGTKYQNEQQKQDILFLCADLKPLDYVTCWYKKADDLILGKKTKCAFVSTNSITQGEQIAPLWNVLKNIQIDFAYRTFRWDSESNEKAQVHCVIIGFSQKDSAQKQKIIFDESGIKRNVENINGYLLDAPNIYVASKSKPICECAPKMTKGSQPADGQNLLMTEEEKDLFLKKSPQFEPFIRRYMGAEDVINNTTRYCFWLKNCPPDILRSSAEVMSRIEGVRQARLKSTKAETRKWANYPTVFTEDRQPDNDYIIVPVVSSENRRYVPISFVTKDVVANTNAQMITTCDLFTFGIINSSVHNTWMRTVCGRMKSDYAYSATIVYNNFPWPNATDAQKAKIEKTAQAILDARAMFPQATLADLYDNDAMPIELRKAHEANDKAVMDAYGYGAKMTENKIIVDLLERYKQLTANQSETKTKGRKKAK